MLIHFRLEHLIENRLDQFPDRFISLSQNQVLDDLAVDRNLNAAHRLLLC